METAEIMFYISYELVTHAKQHNIHTYLCTVCASNSHHHLNRIAHHLFQHSSPLLRALELWLRLLYNQAENSIQVVGHLQWLRSVRKTTQLQLNTLTRTWILTGVNNSACFRWSEFGYRHISHIKISFPLYAVLEVSNVEQHHMCIQLSHYI